jgi:BASS family bile acid:Na+ symporter
MFDLQFTNFGTTMAKLRSILMPVAILLGILLPQAHVLSPALPFMIGLMMFLTFVGKVPPQQHGYTFKIEVKAFLASLVMLAVLWGVVEFFQLPREVLLGGAIICLCPPANAAPAMAKVLGGNPVLALKIFLSGNIIACFSIPLIYGYLTGIDASFTEVAWKIFNSIQPIISIPLAIALGIRSFYPELADKAARFQKYTLLVWTLSVFVILAKASFDIREMGFVELWNSGKLPMLALVSLILCLVQFVVGWFSDKKHPIESSQSMGQKNTTLVIWISSLYAGPVAAIAPTCYVIWQNLVLSWMSGKKKAK